VCVRVCVFARAHVCECVWLGIEASSESLSNDIRELFSVICLGGGDREI
jgi:hypothetical protein